MLKLSYIICGELPEYEEKYLIDNIGNTNHEVKMIRDIWLNGELTFLQNSKSVLQDLAKNSLYISSERSELYQAAKVGMTTICYLPPQADASKEYEASMPKEGSESITSEEHGIFTPDMYVEGFEEVDFTFLQHVYERHHHIPWKILETERCIVKEFSMEYLDALFELYAGEGMTDYIEPLYPYEQEKEYQQAYIDHMYAFYGYGMWIVCEKETGRLIGRIGIEHREELDGELELGYAIGTPYQRHGYATEVCLAILAYVKEELEVLSICCLIEEGNEVSEHLAEKLGFSFEETVQLQGKNMKKYRVFL